MSDSDWLNIIADDSLPSPRTKRKSKFFGCIPPESGSTIFQAWWWDVYNPNLDFTRDSRKANQHKMEQMKVKSPPGVTGVYKCPQKDRPHWKFLQISLSASIWMTAHFFSKTSEFLKCWEQFEKILECLEYENLYDMQFWFRFKLFKWPTNVVLNSGFAFRIVFFVRSRAI